MTSQPTSSADLDAVIDEIFKNAGSGIKADSEYEFDLKKEYAIRAKVKDLISDQVKAARYDELEFLRDRFVEKLKTNADVGTGDFGGFNSGVNALLRFVNDRSATLSPITKQEAEA